MNQSVFRYKRDFILKNYRNLPPPWLACRDEVLDIVFDEPNPPLLNAFFPFVQPFGEELGSRKFPQRDKKYEQMPEWYQDDEGTEDLKPGKMDNSDKTGILDGFRRNSDREKEKEKEKEKGDSGGGDEVEVEVEVEDRFSRIDLQVEEKLKDGHEEDCQEVPQWDEPDEDDFEFGGNGIEGIGRKGFGIRNDLGPAHHISANPQVSKSQQIPQIPQPAQVPQILKTSQHIQASPSLHSSSHTQVPRAPVYDINLLKYHLTIANPFAQLLIHFQIPLEGGAVTFSANSKPFEKMWFYKDLELKVHGPFSTLEMFSWTIRNCFPSDLQIALTPLMTFVPMYIFNSLAQEAEIYGEPVDRHTQLHKKDYKKYQKPNESATLYLKDMLGINKRGK